MTLEPALAEGAEQDDLRQHGVDADRRQQTIEHRVR